MIISAEYEYTTLPEPLEESTAMLTVYPAGDPERHPGSYAMLVRRTTFAEMTEMKAKLPIEAKIVGIPAMWAVGLVEGVPRLFVWPAPEYDLFARFRYCPAIKEI